MLKRLRPTGVLRRLRSDEHGNVLALTAASMFALLGMGGGAIDISRLYLVKTRLQQACDAGALAYRRSMQGTNVVPGVTYPAAQAYFTANFTPGRYGTTSVVFPEPTVDANVVVHASATAVVPMSLMKLFGVQERTLATTCDAQLQLSNTDVMFVLDTTGSMTDTNPGDSQNKIASLKQAVVNFYNQLENVKLPGAQVRYGFVPYSNTVNVGLLLRRDWMADSVSYQSRVFDKQVKEQTGTEGAAKTTYSAWTPDTYTTFTSYGDPENCVAPTNTGSVTNTPPNSGWSPSATALPRSRTNYRTYTGSVYSASVNSSGQCVITERRYDNVAQQRTETVSDNPNSGQPTYAYRNYWWYRPVDFDVRGYKGTAASGLMTGGSVNYPLNSPDNESQVPKNRSVAWGGCIEERKTLRSGEGGTAWDLDVDTVPTAGNPDTQWRPFLPGLVYARAVGNYNVAAPTGWTYPAYRNYLDYVLLQSYPYNRAACPSASRKLTSKENGLTATVLQNYLNALAPRGDTYHDIGFLWGLRLISKEGLFSSENTTAPNGNSIARNIIFMTDGDTETHFHDYDAYGLSALDRRRTSTSSLPSDSDQNTIVEDRLTQLCQVAKNQKGITVWVIAFGTTLTPLLSGCASQGRAYQANNSSQLNAAFAEIAAKIARLRLTR